MTALSICPSCFNHIREHEATCPFCGVVRASPTPGLSNKLAVVAATIITVLSIAACAYGLPPRTPMVDAGVDAQAPDAPHANAR